MVEIEGIHMIDLESIVANLVSVYEETECTQWNYWLSDDPDNSIAIDKAARIRDALYDAGEVLHFRILKPAWNEQEEG